LLSAGQSPSPSPTSGNRENAGSEASPDLCTNAADHYQYVACIGPIALVIGTAARGLERGGVDLRTRKALAAALLLALGIATSAQSRVYLSRETLWKDTIAKNPGSWMAHTNLGRHYLKSERFSEAIPAFESALELRPETYRAHVGLARAMESLDRGEETVRHLQQALAIRPDLAELHEYAARVKWRQGDREGALAHYRAMIDLAPQSPRAHLKLGRALELLDRVDEAQTHYQRALTLDPDLTPARRSLRRLNRRTEPAP
jgi:tetratricopeptide (TPR) repeat protein